VDKPVDKSVGEKRQTVRKGPNYLEQGMGSQKRENASSAFLGDFGRMGLYTGMGEN
jgi:hypothetical protein